MCFSRLSSGILEQRVAADELFENTRRESGETQFLKHNADLNRMQLSFYESRSDNDERSRVVDYPREPTGSPRRMSSLISNPPPELSVQRSLATELQAAAVASSNEKTVSSTPTEGRSALRDVKRNIARAGRIAAQALQRG